MKKQNFQNLNRKRPELTNKALSRSLKFMEEQELIIKVVDENDKSNINYYLTDKGRSLNKVIYDLVEFTLDTNEEYYNEETVTKTKKVFKRQLLK